MPINLKLTKTGRSQIADNFIHSSASIWGLFRASTSDDPQPPFDFCPSIDDGADRSDSERVMVSRRLNSAP
jgi:hypothetical protein